VGDAIATAILAQSRWPRSCSRGGLMGCRLRHLAATALSAASVAACGSATDTPTSPSALATETFQATLQPGGVATHSFTSTGGRLEITMVSAPGAVVGLGLGTWSASSGRCTLVLSSPSAKQGDVFQAVASVGGAYCVQVGDAGGISDPVDYTLTVAHP
jgi:hypothetical protein